MFINVQPTLWCAPGDLQGPGTDGGALHRRVLRSGDTGRVSDSVGDVPSPTVLLPADSPAPVCH